MHVHIHSTSSLGLRFWDWEITDQSHHLVASGRSNRWAGAADAVTRELAKPRS